MAQKIVDSEEDSAARTEKNNAQEENEKEPQLKEGRNSPAGSLAASADSLSGRQSPAVSDAKAASRFVEWFVRYICM